jgi:hypothetical protein
MSMFKTTDKVTVAMTIAQADAIMRLVEELPCNEKHNNDLCEVRDTIESVLSSLHILEDENLMWSLENGDTRVDEMQEENEAVKEGRKTNL